MSHQGQAVMKVYSIIVSMTLILSLALTTSQSLATPYMPRSDNGFIEAMLDEKIVVQGYLGTHVLELIGVCTWCEVGMQVAVRFISVTRAELVQTDTGIAKPPVNVLILIDGREQP